MVWLPAGRCYVRHLGADAPCLRPASSDVGAIDQDLEAKWHTCVGRFEIYDRAVRPEHQWVMRVQEPDGSYRPLDGRVLAPLMEARGRPVSELIAQMEHNEDAIERETDKRIRALGEDLYEITNAMGKRVMGYGGNSVTWQKRTDPAARERIRAVA